MKKRDNRSREALTKEQSQELAHALADGFVIYGHLRAGIIHPLEGIVDEPFFGAQASTGGTGDVCYPDFVASMRNDGCTNDEILAEYEDYLDSQVSEDAPHWRETNPFNFGLQSIKDFFWKRYGEHYGAADNAIDHGGEPLEPGAFLICEEPYSKTWFELQILSQINQMQFSLDDLEQGKYARISLIMVIKYAGGIGRLVENYRWRFSYGADAIRGRANINAAREGARARARGQVKKTTNVIGLMSKYIAANNSVSNAARLTFKAGLGTSAEANRKLWNRHQMK